MIDIALTKRQGAFQLSAAFSVEGGVTALFGRSGAGKTSIVAMTAGLSRPDSGRIAIGDAVLFDSGQGVDIAPDRRRVGMVFQDGRLFPHMTVRANLRYGERLVPAAERYAAFDKVVDLLDIAPLLDRRPARLSGGEKQRVAIGRALLSSPRLLLMDEPLAALDGARKAEILPFIARLSREFSVPILYVSHAIDEIIAIADNLVVMEQGQVSASGTLEQVLSAVDLSPITGRLDAGSILYARVEGHLPADGLSRLTVGPSNHLLAPLVDAPPGTMLRVRIAAQEVSLALERPRRISIQNVLTGTVQSIAPAGDGQIDVHVALDDENKLWTRITRMALDSMGLESGQTVFALVKTNAIAKSGIAAARKTEP